MIAVGALAAAVLLTTPGYAEDSHADPNGTPNNFIEWIIDLFSSSDEGDTGILIDPNG